MVVGVVLRRSSAGALLIQIHGEGVVTELHGPGEMIIELQALHRTAPQGFHNQTDEPLADSRMRGIQPGHAVAAVQQHPALTIGPGKHPLGMVPHHLGIGRLHQAVFKPGHHLNAALTPFLHQRADRINGQSRLLQRRLHRCIGTPVKRGAATPDIGQDPIESCSLELLHRFTDAGTVVIERARTVGQPDTLRLS